MSINRTYSVWHGGYERRSLEDAKGALAKARAIERGRAALESMVPLSPTDDVDRAMKQCMGLLTGLSATDEREVRAALRAYVLERTHGRNWDDARDSERVAC